MAVGNVRRPLASRVYMSAGGTLNLPPASSTVIPWDTLDFDTGGFWPAGVAGKQITIPLTGIYRFTVQVQVDGVIAASYDEAGQTAEYELDLYNSTQNWDVYGPELWLPSNPAAALVSEVYEEVLRECAAGDNVRPFINVYRPTGFSGTLELGLTPDDCFFTAEYLGSQL